MIEDLTHSKNNKTQHIYSSEKPYVIGIDVYCNEVYSLTYGEVVYIGRSNGTFTVNVRCNNNEVVRYGNLKEVDVSLSQYVSSGQLIGAPQKFVQFEYCTLWRGISNNPVRINAMRYYKQDPTDVIDGTYIIAKDNPVEFKASRASARAQVYTAYEESEFGDNKGE